MSSKKLWPGQLQRKNVFTALTCVSLIFLLILSTTSCRFDESRVVAEPHQITKLGSYTLPPPVKEHPVVANEPVPIWLVRTEAKPQLAEPWPGKGEYDTYGGNSPFSVVYKGKRLRLFRVEGGLLAVGFPFVGLIAGNKLHELPALPVVHADTFPHQWQVEKISGTWPDKLTLELDILRRGTAPSNKRTAYTWRDGGWEVQQVPLSNAFTVRLPWAGGRLLEVRTPYLNTSYHLTWIRGDGPLPSFATPASSSDVRYEFVDGSFVFGGDTFVYGRSCIDKHYVIKDLQACREIRYVIDHFPAGSLQGKAIMPPPKEYYSPEIIPFNRDSWFAVGSCNFEEEKSGHEVCLSHFDGKKWSWIEVPHKLPLQNIEITGEETLWMVTGIDATANASSRYFGYDDFQHPPQPVGELHRWRQNRCWQRLRFPESPVQLKGWRYLRFVPLEVVALGENDIWVNGFWYYVRRQATARLEMKKVGGLLHLDQKVKWSCGGLW